MKHALPVIRRTGLSSRVQAETVDEVDGREAGLHCAGICKAFEVEVLDRGIGGQELVFASSNFADGADVDIIWLRGWRDQGHDCGSHDAKGGILQSAVLADGIGRAGAGWEDNTVVKLSGCQRAVGAAFVMTDLI